MSSEHYQLAVSALESSLKAADLIASSIIGARRLAAQAGVPKDQIEAMVFSSFTKELTDKIDRAPDDVYGVIGMFAAVLLRESLRTEIRDGD